MRFWKAGCTGYKGHLVPVRTVSSDAYADKVCTACLCVHLPLHTTLEVRKASAGMKTCSLNMTQKRVSDHIFAEGFYRL